MAQDPPAWLNSQFLEKALKSSREEPNLKIIACEISPATQPGDNFGSDMFRAVLKIEEKGEPEDTSVIIKCRLAKTPEKHDGITTEAFFREATFFSDISMLMMKEAFLEEFQPFAAKFIYSRTEPSEEGIVLEDLKRSGFTLAKVSLGLDLKHCLLVMRTLANYHASSLVIREKYPDIFEPFMENLIVKYDTDDIAEFNKICIKNILKEIENWPGYEKYIEPLNRLIPVARKTWLQNLTRDDSEFNVLLHGDLWMNNMMFQYSPESGEVQNVRFVDYQLLSVLSPSVDLQYFINSSASPEVMENNLDDLLDEYYSTLCRNLVKLRHEHLQPTFDTLKSEFHKRGLYGCLACFSIRTVVLGDRNHVPDLQEITTTGDLHSSNAYQTAIKRILPLYEKWGWLKL